jgi:hypothetical protein
MSETTRRPAERPTSPFRLTKAQRDRLVATVEAALARWDGVELYWPDGEIHVRPVRWGKAERL